MGACNGVTHAGRLPHLSPLSSEATHVIVFTVLKEALDALSFIPQINPQILKCDTSAFCLEASSEGGYHLQVFITGFLPLAGVRLPWGALCPCLWDLW